jgi:hypothetical protein
VSARAAIGNSAAVAVAPSNRFRRVTVIANSSVDLQLSMKRLKVTVKPQRTAKAAH